MGIELANTKKWLIMRHLFLVLMCFLWNIETQASDKLESFQVEYSSLRGATLERVKEFSWKKHCPVKLSELMFLKISYFGFDDKPHIGELIVHRKAAPEIILIFKELFESKFPIESLEPMYMHLGSDNQSMIANNTVAFNCRQVTNYKKAFSLHSYGIAIDINPFINPYYKKGKVIPPSARVNLDRKKSQKGLIAKNTIAYDVFKRYGWKWGGDWKSLKDYQHFEKRLSVFKKEKRYSLTFKHLPAGASIKVMNILKPYTPTKFLARGLYDVKIISKNETKRLWIKIDKNRIVHYSKL